MFTVKQHTLTNGNNVLLNYTTPTISIGNITTLASGTRTNSTINVPTGVVDGDLLVMGFVINNQSPILGGWQLLTRTLDTYRLYIYYRIASSEPISYTITHVNALTNGGIIVVKPQAGLTPNLSIFDNNLNTTSTLLTCPSIAGVANSVLLCFGVTLNGTMGGGLPHISMTERWELDLSTSATNYLMTQFLTRTTNTGIKYIKSTSSRTSRCISALVTQL